MRLQNLIASNEDLKLRGGDIDITGLATDSRKVERGTLFIAIPGTQYDGRAYIPEAIKNGAAAIVVPEGTPVNDVARVVTTTQNMREVTSSLAAQFYPRQPETIVAVTGTSGKTSTAQFTREIWASMGFKSASIGTLGLVTSKETRYGSLTTPDPITLHQMMDESVENGTTHLAMEASSHGLALNRMDYVHLKAGGFTNLSHDHLDYHQTMESYLAAKMRLFNEVLPADSAAVLNADIPAFDAVDSCARSRGLKVISYGLKAKEIKLIESKPDTQGQFLKIELFGKKHNIKLPVIGAFQIWNSLCALGMVLGSGGDEHKALEAMAQVSGVPGRLQLVGSTTKGATIFVDYAHKPDALENVLQALRPHVAAHSGARLGVVFGCGGNRDKAKRPIMGEIAQRLADWVIVTDDNPRHEEPSTIRQEILAGCKAGPHLQEIADREKALAEGINKLRSRDVLIIAGKGHESGQIIGDTTLPFDDTDVVRKVLGL